jgi:hypothetical protein
MAKKPKTLKLTKCRNLLLRNCEALIDRFETTNIYLEVGQAYTKAAVKVITSSDTPAAHVRPRNYLADSLGGADLLILVQTALLSHCARM